MYLWYETEKDKGERETGKQDSTLSPKDISEGYISGDPVQRHCKCFVIRNTEQTWNCFFCLAVLPGIL